MTAERNDDRSDVPDDSSIAPEGWLIPTLDELHEIDDDPTVDFENSDAREDDDDRRRAFEL